MEFFLVAVLFVSGLGSVINGQTVTTLPRLVSEFKFKKGFIIKKLFNGSWMVFVSQIGEISASVPAFADIHESSDSSLPYADRFTLYVSTFKPFQLKVLNVFLLFQKYS